MIGLKIFKIFVVPSICVETHNSDSHKNGGYSLRLLSRVNNLVYSLDLRMGQTLSDKYCSMHSMRSSKIQGSDRKIRTKS